MSCDVSRTNASLWGTNMSRIKELIVAASPAADSQDRQRARRETDDRQTPPSSDDISSVQERLGQVSPTFQGRRHEKADPHTEGHGTTPIGAIGWGGEEGGMDGWILLRPEGSPYRALTLQLRAKPHSSFSLSIVALERTDHHQTGQISGAAYVIHYSITSLILTRA